MKRYAAGSVHGRFQPLHKGHLEYLLKAKRHCDFLFVGITQCDNQTLLDSPEAPHRRETENNPMTYEERVDMITRVLMDEGLGSNEFAVIPFPIETPERLKNYLPTTVPIFTTVYDDWNRHKIKVLRENGYKVIILWKRSNKKYDGTGRTDRTKIGRR